MRSVYTLVFLLAVVTQLAFVAPSLAAEGATTEFKWSGSGANVATDFKRHYINFGGPHVKCTTGDFIFGLGFYPSLKYDTTVTGTTIKWGMALGAGPFVGYKHLNVSMPIYFNATNALPALGIGYIF